MEQWHNTVQILHTAEHTVFTLCFLMICYDIFVNCNWVATRWQ